MQSTINNINTDTVNIKNNGINNAEPVNTSIIDIDTVTNTTHSTSINKTNNTNNTVMLNASEDKENHINSIEQFSIIDNIPETIQHTKDSNITNDNFSNINNNINISNINSSYSTPDSTSNSTPDTTSDTDSGTDSNSDLKANLKSMSEIENNTNIKKANNTEVNTDMNTNANTNIDTMNTDMQTNEETKKNVNVNINNEQEEKIKNDNSSKNIEDAELHNRLQRVINIIAKSLERHFQGEQLSCIQRQINALFMLIEANEPKYKYSADFREAIDLFLALVVSGRLL